MSTTVRALLDDLRTTRGPARVSRLAHFDAALQNVHVDDLIQIVGDRDGDGDHHGDRDDDDAHGIDVQRRLFARLAASPSLPLSAAHTILAAASRTRARAHHAAAHARLLSSQLKALSACVHASSADATLITSLVDLALACLALGQRRAPAPSHSRASSVSSWRSASASSSPSRSTSTSSSGGGGGGGGGSSATTGFRGGSLAFSASGGASVASSGAPAHAHAHAHAPPPSASSASETDDDAVRQGLAEAHRSARTSALRLLSTLVEAHSALMLPHWTRLFDPAPALAPAPAPATAATASSSLLYTLEQDHSLAVRITACHALGALLHASAKSGMLNAAQERSLRLQSFTPLSARIANCLVALRQALTAALHRAIAQAQAQRGVSRALASYTDALLKLSRTLVQTTPKAKLRLPHSALLRDPALSLSSSSESSIAVSAYALLASLLQGGAGAGVAGASASLAPDEQDHSMPLLATLLNTIEADDCEDGIATQAWSTLAALIDRHPVEHDHYQHILQLVLRDCKSPSRADSSAAAFLVVLKAAQQHATLSPPLPLPLAASIIRACMRSASATCRALMADALPAWSALATPDTLSTREILKDLACDGEATVRASAARAFGGRAQAEARVFDGRAQASDAVVLSRASDAVVLSRASDAVVLSRASDAVVLSRASDAVVLSRASDAAALDPILRSLLRDPSPLVRLRACWSFANLVECRAHARAPTPVDTLAPAPAPAHVDASPATAWETLASVALVAAQDEERIAMHAHRALGALLECAPLQSVETCMLAFTLLFDRLSKAKTSPKAHWNASSAVARALSSSSATHHRWNLVERKLNDELVSCLLVCLLPPSQGGTQNIKTRTLALVALQRAAPLFAACKASTRSRLEDTISTLASSIESQIREARFKEAQLHGAAFREALRGLERERARVAGDASGSEARASVGEGGRGRGRDEG